MRAAMAEVHRDVAIMQPGYLPWLGYFDLAATADVFVLYDDVQFDKGGWRNRNRILGPRDRPLWLTAPAVTAGRLQQSIKDTVLTEDKWQVRHLRSIKQTYARAPFFDWCFPSIDSYLGQRRFKWLLELCLDGHHAIAGLLRLSAPVRLASELGFAGIGRTERLVAICTSLGASRYIAADASQAYMDEPLWARDGLSLVYQRYPHPVYPQFREPFVSHLSIIDALMFVGPATRGYLGISHPKHKGPVQLAACTGSSC